jgi:hypothetical protein
VELFIWGRITPSGRLVVRKEAASVRNPRIQSVAHALALLDAHRSKVEEFYADPMTREKDNAIQAHFDASETAVLEWIVRNAKTPADSAALTMALYRLEVLSPRQ